MDLSSAQEIGRRLIESTRESCKRIEIAGSVRREKSSVKDIELVAIVSDYEAFYAALSRHGRFIKPGVPDIIEWAPKGGAKYVRMLLNEDVKLDIFIGNEDNWGALLCMRTGSGVGPNGSPFNGFIPQCFRRWKKVSGGGRMSDCQPTMPDGLQLAVPEERDFFDLLDIEWVEPRDRVSSKDVKPVKRGR